MDSRRIGITWQLSDSHGWGVFGLNFAYNLIVNGPAAPMIFADQNLTAVPNETITALTPFFNERVELLARIEANGGHALFDEAVLIHALSDDFRHSEISDKARGHHNVGFVFFENGEINADSVERAKQWDRVLVGSSWNLERCQASGIDGAVFVSQGIDPDHFKPVPRTDAPKERFVIYSGGKLEVRKGQDQVLAAFKRFVQIHPDSLLITSWQNHWPQTIQSLVESPHVNSLPGLDEKGNLRIVDWALAHGIPPNTVVDTGWVPNTWLPKLLSQADVALFPNRGEGGTNLAAMEAMACGVPCIVSANTGHLDLIGEDNCYVLEDQSPGNFSADPGRHWRDSSIDEIVDKLEMAYADAADRTRRGDNGAAFMKNISWETQVAKIADSISDFL